MKTQIYQKSKSISKCIVFTIPYRRPNKGIIQLIEFTYKISSIEDLIEALNTEGYICELTENDSTADIYTLSR